MFVILKVLTEIRHCSSIESILYCDTFVWALSLKENESTSIMFDLRFRASNFPNTIKWKESDSNKISFLLQVFKIF